MKLLLGFAILAMMSLMGVIVPAEKKFTVVQQKSATDWMHNIDSLTSCMNKIGRSLTVDDAKAYQDFMMRHITEIVIQLQKQAISDLDSLKKTSK